MKIEIENHRVLLGIVIALAIWVAVLQWRFHRESARLEDLHHQILTTVIMLRDAEVASH